jgi:phosphomannomutase
MLAEEVLIGGEESGGVGLSRHLPERDGTFVNLLFLDMLATSGKTCTQLIQTCGGNLVSFTLTGVTSTCR